MKKHPAHFTAENLYHHFTRGLEPTPRRRLIHILHTECPRGLLEKAWMRTCFKRGGVKLIVMPGATSSDALDPSSDALCY